MILGRVVGEVWATKKHGKLQGYKLLVVRPQCWYEPSHEVEHLVAIDTSVDAGVGDDVIVCMGEPSRWQSEGPPMPVDAAIMAVVDGCQIDSSAFSVDQPRPLCLLGGGPRSLVVDEIATSSGVDPSSSTKGEEP